MKKISLRKAESMKTYDYSIKPLFTNNDRRRAGLPTRRKGKGKRYKTRREPWETFCAWYDWISAK